MGCMQGGCAAGKKKENVAVYQFLKEPLIRKFGEKWYQELEIAVEELKAHDMI